MRPSGGQNAPAVQGMAAGDSRPLSLAQWSLTTMRPEEALRAAAQFIRDGGLSQGANARDENGREVPLWSTGSSETGRAVPNPAGVRFSIYGAIVKAIHHTPEGVRRQTLMFDVAFRVALRWLDQEAAGATGGTNRVHAVDQLSEAPGRTSGDAARFLEECASECEKIGDGPYQPPIDPKTGVSLRTVLLEDGEVEGLTRVYDGEIDGLTRPHDFGDGKEAAE